MNNGANAVSGSYAGAGQTAIPMSGVRIELDRLRDIAASMAKTRAEIEVRIHTVIAGSEPQKQDSSQLATAPSCDLQAELADLRRSFEDIAMSYGDLLERVRL